MDARAARARAHEAFAGVMRHRFAVSQLAAGVLPARAGRRAPRRATGPARPQPAVDGRGGRDRHQRRPRAGGRVRHQRPRLPGRRGHTSRWRSSCCSRSVAARPGRAHRRAAARRCSSACCSGRSSRARRDQRDRSAQLTALGADIVAGLRVLRGIGGEQAFLARYRARVAGGPRRPASAWPGSQSDLDARAGPAARAVRRPRHLARARASPSPARSPRASWSRSTATRRSSSCRCAPRPRPPTS